MCYSITIFEHLLNLLTTSGIAPADKGTFTVDVPDYALDQAVPTTAPQELPGGKEETWERSKWTYYPTTRTMTHFLHGGLQYDQMISGPYKGGTGAGTIVYEGGHEYTRTLPYLGNKEAPYLRFLLNSVLLATGLPEIDVTVSPTTIPSGIATPVTVDVKNIGGSAAGNLGLTITLDPSVVPASVVWSVPPTVGAFPTTPGPGSPPLPIPR